MRRAFLLLPIALSAFEPPPLDLGRPLRDRNFPLLALLERTPAARAAAAGDPELRRLLAERTGRIAACGADAACLVAAFRLGPEGASAVAALPELARAVRASGAFARHDALDDRALLAAAWSETARGIDQIIDVYALGKPPRYPAIDAPSFDTAGESYQRLLVSAALVAAEEMPSLFFEPSVDFALRLLDLNWRDEAARFEPLHRGENGPAYRAIPGISWDRYPYSVIVVPGAGLDRAGFALSPFAKLRVELAARRWRRGVAPLILVSGGFVHPNQTPYAEAIEMKKHLMREFGVPESAILVDPHARHTTTNLRNAARQIFRYGIPPDKPALVTTDPGQSRYIEEPGFADRCRRELGYVPHELGKRLNAFDLEFRPLRAALHADPLDPLDP